jgi:hypothetical protein
MGIPYPSFSIAATIFTPDFDSQQDEKNEFLLIKSQNLGFGRTMEILSEYK